MDKFVYMKKSINHLALIVFSLILILPAQLSAQINEPEVQEVVRNISNIQNEYDSGFGFNVVMNNFGFGLGGEFRKVVAPKTEITASMRIGGLRDASEQTFTDYFFGQQIIPNKYQRAFAFPLLLGMRHRLFSNIIQDDYRFFLSASIGPVASFSYPYFEDVVEDGYRQTGNEYIVIDEETIGRVQPEQINDIFSGWSQGDWHFGGTGEMKIGLDIGKNFTRLSSIEFGYYFYYFPDGIQLMMPNQPVPLQNSQQNTPFTIYQTDENGDFIMREFEDAQKFFGSPQITFTFGWLW